jgi:glutathione synthase
MTTQLGIVMDPLMSINLKKDSTLAMIEAAQKRNWSVFYLEQKDLFIVDGIAMANMHPLKIDLHVDPWFQLGEPVTRPLHELNVILMRKDPPFNMEYIYTTYILELAQKRGTLVVNNPQSLRDANEKLFTQWFPQCCPPTLVSCNPHLLRDFARIQQDVIIKPLGGMGGFRIFRTRHDDLNLSVILEAMTDYGREFTMAQRYIPEIIQGDKRVLLIDGEPVPYALARIPQPGELRGNLAAGGIAKVVPLSERDRWICAEVGATLREKGLLFVGLDIIGDYLTEVNVTSPTCIREIEAETKLKIAEQLLDTIEKKL